MIQLPAVQSLEDSIREILHDHGLRLVEATWKRNFDKRSLDLAFKISGELEEQTELGLAE